MPLASPERSGGPDQPGVDPADPGDGVVGDREDRAVEGQEDDLRLDRDEEQDREGNPGERRNGTQRLDRREGQVTYRAPAADGQAQRDADDRGDHETGAHTDEAAAGLGQKGAGAQLESSPQDAGRPG